MSEKAVIFERKMSVEELAAIKDKIDQLTKERDGLRDALKDAVLQIEYLHAKFTVTGTGEAVLAKARTALQGVGK